MFYDFPLNIETGCLLQQDLILYVQMPQLVQTSISHASIQKTDNHLERGKLFPFLPRLDKTLMHDVHANILFPQETSRVNSQCCKILIIQQFQGFLIPFHKTLIYNFPFHKIYHHALYTNKHSVSR